MPNTTFVPVEGTIQSIHTSDEQCCQQTVTIRNQDGVTNFIVTPDTYVIGEVRLRPGMTVTAFYDATMPVPLIYPPQYQTLFIGRKIANETITAGHFNNELIAEDGSLKLNLSPATEILTSNGQKFNCSLEGRLLIVYYTATTRSIPPQTTPRKIIVMC